MVLFETRGLRLSSIVREGIGWIRRLACLKHGPDLSDGYFPSKPSVSWMYTRKAFSWEPFLAVAVGFFVDIFSAGHKGCSFLEGMSQALKTYSKRGAL
jgi:hypothetical protein